MLPGVSLQTQEAIRKFLIFMKKKMIKRFLIGTGTVLLLLVMVLAIHIYVVTRPKAPDAHTRIMARIDIRQDITRDDADKITAWLYQQKGIDHVLCNPQSDIVVFTFFPIKTSADKIVKDFKSSLPYKAERYMPSESEMKSGCPVASTSFSYKVYSFFKHTF
jgi:hypothetical protein